jgi:hypothetical protein
VRLVFWYQPHPYKPRVISWILSDSHLSTRKNGSKKIFKELLKGNKTTALALDKPCADVDVYAESSCKEEDYTGSAFNKFANYDKTKPHSFLKIRGCKIMESDIRL